LPQPKESTIMAELLEPQASAPSPSLISTTLLVYALFGVADVTALASSGFPLIAPLTGLVEAIVDLTATGTTLRENGLVVREEIVTSTARLIANPVAHKLRADAVDAVVEGLRGS